MDVRVCRCFFYINRVSCVIYFCWYNFFKVFYICEWKKNNEKIFKNVKKRRKLNLDFLDFSIKKNKKNFLQQKKQNVNCFLKKKKLIKVKKNQEKYKKINQNFMNKQNKNLQVP